MSIWSKLFGAKTPAVDAAMVAAARDGMMNVLTRMGTPQDKRSAGVYAAPKILSDRDLDNMYAGSWLAGKIIDIPVDDMTRMGWTRKWKGSDKDISAVAKVQDAEERFETPTRISRIAKWGRLYGGSLLVPVIKNQRLDEPLLLDSIKLNSLQNFLEFDRYDVTPSTTLDDNPESPNMGMPVSYRWNEKGLEIHWSRAIRFGGREAPKRIKKTQQYWDDSILRRIVEVVSNYDQAEGGVASLILEAKIDILAMKGLRETLAEDGGEAKIQTRIQTALLMKSIWQTLVVDAGDGGGEQGNGDRFDNKQVSFANLDKILDRLGISVAGAADIPMTRLFGMSPGGQNSTGDSDDDNYDDHIAALQRTQLKPRLKRIDEIMIRSALGSMPDDYTLTFNPLTQTDPKEAAEIMKLQMETLTGYAAEGYVPDDFPIRQLKAWGTMSALEDTDVALVQNQIEEDAGAEEDDDAADDPAEEPAAA